MKSLANKVWRDGKKSSLNTLVGERIAYIDVDEGNYEILITTVSGDTIMIYHDQKCCETVSIESTEGDWYALKGKVVVETVHEESQAEVPPGLGSNLDSCTRSTLKLRVDDATVISRWIGVSNGFYSESVDIAEIASPGGE